MVIDLLVAAVLVFVGVKIGTPGAVLVWVFAAVFAGIGFLQGWVGFRRG